MRFLTDSSKVLGFLSLLLAVLACGADPRVTILTQSGHELAVHVEIADTPEMRSRGLQYRRELDGDQGMLFIFPTERVHSFWMKNTPIPLDMIFIRSDGRVVGVVHNAVPFSTVSRSVSAPSQFVLEIKGGLARRIGIKGGDLVRFEGFPLKGVRE
ncbi:MAG: DUF192 domain-containing protein [Candidatus Binatia bacterium]